ncbi:MAG: radical SAM protein [Deltaproteobacteria bacterium]|nr:radical SAM protein [Deltaproteobacteria bacterium]
MTGGSEFVFQWHLTERCNLACTHCYQTGAASAELTLAELLAVADEVAEAVDAWGELCDAPMAPAFHLTGGEPLLRPELFDLLAALNAGGFAAWLLTNGTLVDQRAADRLAETCLAGAQVSLEGPEEVHDRIRGRGSFEAAIRGVGRLLASGVRVDLNVTLSRLNAPHVHELVAIARATGVQRIGFSRLVPWGRGSELEAQMLDPAELREVYRTLASAGTDGLAISTRDPLTSAEEAHRLGDVPVGGCAAGLWGVTLMPDGTLYPCRRLPLPIGNLRTDSLREVWANSEVLQRLRDKTSYTGACGRCDRWADCRGCRAVAFAAGGTPDYLGDDPQCYVALVRSDQ